MPALQLRLIAPTGGSARALVAELTEGLWPELGWVEATSPVPGTGWPGPGLAAADPAAWAAYWRRGAFSPVLRLAPDDLPIPENVLRDPTARAALRAALLAHRSLLPYLELTDRGPAAVTLLDRGHLIGPDLLLTTGPGEEPEGGWVPFRHLRHVAAYQRDGSVVPTYGPRLAAPPDLDLHVAPGGSQELAVEGLTVLLTGEQLSFRGPDRSLAVYADGAPVARVVSAAAVIDLRGALDARSLAAANGATRGPRPDYERMLQAAELDATAGIRHRYDIHPDPPSAGQPATVTVSADVPLREGWVYYTVDGSAPLGTQGAVGRGRAAPLRSSGDGVLTGEIPGQPEGSIVRYQIDVTDGESWTEVSDAGPDYAWPLAARPFARPPRRIFSYRVHEPRVPEWARRAVVYQVVVDRFASTGEGLLPAEQLGFLAYGNGTLRGLSDRLPYIRDLGVDVVWVSPIHAGCMNMNYDVTDLTGVDPRLGSADDVRALCRRAHGLGLRLILDIELSYLGAQHPIVRAALENPQGAERSWLVWDAELDRPFGWFGSTVFTALDHSHPEVRKMLVDAARYWLGLGFDGFRLDSAHHASYDFWTEFGAALDSGRNFAVAEATRPLSECLRYHGRLHGFLDFELAGAIRDFAAGSTAPGELSDLLRARASLPAGLVATTFVENHDLPRLAEFLYGDETNIRLALGLLLTLPGTPVLYYGTEVGLDVAGTVDPDNRRRAPMQWDPALQDQDRLAFVRRLVRLRRTRPSLAVGGLRLLQTDDTDRTLLFARLYHEQTTLVAVSGSDRPASFEVEPKAVGGKLRGELLEGSASIRHAGRRLVLDLPSAGVSVFALTPTGYDATLTN